MVTNEININKMITTPKPGGRNGPNKAVVKIGSWNVRGVNDPLSLLDLVFEAQRQGVSVLCLQKTYIEGNVVRDMGSHILYNSGSNEGAGRKDGFGFLVDAS
ncbi:unnamed protein product [Gordionus sp. m RMFG-2023]